MTTTFVYETDDTAAQIPADVTPDQLAAAQYAITNARITGSRGATYEDRATATVQRLYTGGPTPTATDLWLVTVDGGRPHPVPVADRINAVVHDALADALERIDNTSHERWSERLDEDREDFADLLRPVIGLLLGAVRS